MRLCWQELLLVVGFAVLTFVSGFASGYMVGSNPLPKGEPITETQP